MNTGTGQRMTGSEIAMPLKTNPFPSVYEEFIYKSRYARWLDDKKRRENWDETVLRLVGLRRNTPLG